VGLVFGLSFGAIDIPTCHSEPQRSEERNLLLGGAMLRRCDKSMGFEYAPAPPLANPQSTIYNLKSMDPALIRELLRPFLSPRAAGPEDLANDQRPTADDALSPTQLKNISTYIDLLLRWNARINLTAIRDPEEIVTRHFGESLFAARHLFPNDLANGVVDIGSGPGFPGLPVKIWAPQIHLTLIESNQKKATFLREVVRTLTLTDVDIFAGRAEDFPTPAGVVTLRAVELFDQILPIAASLVAPGGCLALLIGTAQVDRARDHASNFQWQDPTPIPMASSTTLLIGKSSTGIASLPPQR
jgi:16S rRNA (guanine527-N7)-methyltransferase